MHQSSKTQKGLTSIETMIALVALSLLLTAVFIKGTDTETNQLRYSVLLKNMKLVSNAAEEQKRNLGYYPTATTALINKDAYLTRSGNSGQIEKEKLLKTSWQGPYVKNIKIRQNQINLDEIIKGKRGMIVKTGKGVVYTVGEFTGPENKFTEQLYRECVHLDPEAAVIKNTLVMPNYIDVCGYTANAQHITKLSYFIGASK